MNGLLSAFINRLQEALLVCAPFDDFAALTHLFVDARIYPWRKEIRYQPSSIGLINEVIYQLYERHNQAGENALLLFLQVARDRIDPEDACHTRLDLLIREGQEALVNAPGAKDLVENKAQTRAAGGPSMLGRSASPSPLPSSRLEALGFAHDPFAWREAEKISPPELLEELFVAHPDFDAKVMLLDRATVLVAPRGSGKTAGRLALEQRLNQIQQAAFSPYALSEHKRVVPFIAVYNQFEQLIPRLPAIGLPDHQELLAGALAAALLSFVTANKDRFLRLESRTRAWWWSYLATYSRGLPLNYALPDEQLRVDWEQIHDTVVAPFAPKVSIKDLLSSFLQRLQEDFGVNTLFILVDGVDGYLETQSATNLRSLLQPLLGAISLLSLPGIIWKFFLPTMAEEIAYGSAGYRTGRVDLFRLEWDEQSLIELLQRRLVWASSGAVEQLDAIIDQKLRSSRINLESELARIALSYRYGPPRALLAMGQRLFQHGNNRDQPPTPLTEVEWFRFRRWIGQDVRVHQREQLRRLPLQSGDDFALVAATLNSLNDDLLFLAQRGWNELDFYTAQPGELEATLRIFTRALAAAGIAIESAGDEQLALPVRVKMLIPALLDLLVRKTPAALDAHWIPARVVTWLRQIAEYWLRSLEAGQGQTINVAEGS